jgi:hypothetical protein
MPERISLPEIQAALDVHVLQIMQERCDGWYDPTEVAFSLRAFVVDPWITREIARGVCRSLTERGYAVYRRGLWTDDGEPGGAGYGITHKGVAYLKDLWAAVGEGAEADA